MTRRNRVFAVSVLALFVALPLAAAPRRPAKQTIADTLKDWFSVLRHALVHGEAGKTTVIDCSTTGDCGPDIDPMGKPQPVRVGSVPEVGPVT